jgi:dienelactone hydrolase
MRWQALTALVAVGVVGLVLADGPADNIPDKVRPIPPKGIELKAEDRPGLEKLATDFGKEIATLRSELNNRPALAQFLPDVQIYHKAVDWAVRYDEFYKPAELQVVGNLIKQGRDRAESLRAGKTPWTTATGLVVRGYLSKIDGSVQPYGLVVPASYRPDEARPHRLDCWFHGRGEQLSELSFIDGRQKSPGEFTPRDTIVLHLYGRYCNANKFAGEIDLFEAIDHVKKHYRIDEDRIAVRGFSMGGAACWQFAVHYPGRWAAAAPGAGFSETADFLKVFQNEPVKPTWYEKKLWHMYDCTDSAVNLYNLPTVAYSGEIDRQKQAADMMAKALEAEGLQLTHIIGPRTGHSYHPEAKAEINRRIDAIMARGRDRLPRRVKFQTWTLRYNESHWVRVDGLQQHWERGRVEAEVSPEGIRAETKGITALTFTFPPDRNPFALRDGPKVVIDNQDVPTPRPQSDRSLEASYRRKGPNWELASSEESGLRKKHGLQGPIDDAFMDSFLMVKPTGKPMNEKVGAWVEKEMAHAVQHWRSQFRGDARVKTDDAVNESDIANHNLVLWGDPSSNKVLAKIADRLPIHWTDKGVQVGDKTYPAETHVPVLIYPNPLNPKRYVVVNSSFTYREYDYLNNARQVSKLPDWAILDVSVPPNSRFPGKVVDAAFFDEQWKLTAARQ